MTGTQTVGSQITVGDLDRDPYPIYERLRAEEPVSWVEAVGLWLVTRWEDVEYVDMHPELFTAETEPSTLTRTFGKNLLGSEDPYHKRVRAIIGPSLRPAAVRPYAEEIIAPIAHELLDAVAAQGAAELVHAFCEPLSVRSLRQVVGLGEIDDDTLRRWFAELALGASNFEADPDKQRVADAASVEVDETVTPILERLGREPDDSILSRLLHSETGGERLTRDEILSNLKVMIVGGMKEPGDLVGIAVWALLTHPEQAAELRSSPDGLMRQTVEECLRWYSPVGTSTRQTTQSTALGGVELERGALVAAVVSSANRDERRFIDPDRFDIHRAEGAHLAFATGNHFCAGAWLARVETATALRVVLERLPGLRLDGDGAVELEGWEFRGPSRLRVRWDA